MYRLRGHASLVAWLNGSDNPPPPDVEQTYLKVEKELLWPNPIVSSATAKLAGYSGESGVKMTGPYEYVAPSYWQTDKTDSARQCNAGGCGGAYGFNTETSMGPAVPPVESLRSMVGKDHLWPIDDTWNYHAGGGAFKDIHVFTDALNARFGPATSAEDYALKAQLQTYEGVRAMYEAYSRNKYVSMGVIQWMLNNAWPSIIWHLYDFYLRPGGGYFGAKKSMEALHPVYGYDDHSIWIVSSQYGDANGLKLTTKVLNLDMSEKFSQVDTINAAADSTNKVLSLPDIDGLSSTYCRPATGRRQRKTGGIEFLLAFQQAGDARLGKVQLVHDSDIFLRRLHSSFSIAQGQAERGPAGNTSANALAIPLEEVIPRPQVSVPGHAMMSSTSSAPGSPRLCVTSSS